MKGLTALEAASVDEVHDALWCVRRVKRSTTSLPFLQAMVEVDDLVADGAYGVHVVGIHDSRDIVFFSQPVDQLIDDHGCLGIEAGIWLIAEEILWIER